MATTPEDLRIRISAINDSKNAFNQVNTDLSRTSLNAGKTQKAVMGAGTAMSGMGRSAGQAGIQVQQLVGQIQGGTNPMLALSQQAADLGFVLGAPLVGAIAGLAASFAMVLIPALFDTEDRFESLKDKAKELDTVLGDLAPTATAKRIQEIKREIAEANAEIAEQQEKIAELQPEFDRYTKFSLGLQAQRIGGQIRDANIEIEDQQALIRLLNKEIDDLTGSTKKREEATKRLNKELREQEELERIIARDLEIQQERKLKRMDEYAEAHRKAQEEMYKAQDKATEEMAKNLRPLEDGLVNLINGTRSTSEAFKDMARSIINDLIRMQIQSSITQPLAGIIAGAGGFGGILSGLFGGGGAPTATAMAAPNYMPPSFAGGGYTGSGARAGGIDGQGGFPAILHPNETVVDHTQGGAQGVTINQTINVTTGVQQTVRTEIASLMPQIAAASKQAVLDARKRGGSFGAAFGA